MALTIANGEAGSSVRAKLNTLLHAGARSVMHPDYGATGDGSTDDTAAIQLALDANGGEGTVLFPPPSVGYVITQPLILEDITGPRHIQLLGFGDQCLIGGNFAGFLIDRNDAGDSPERNGIRVEGLKFNNASSNAAAGCVRINRAMNVGIINCAAQGVRCYVIDENTFSGVIERCIANGFDYGAGAKAGVGIVIGCNQARVSECDIVGHGEGLRVHYGGEISNNRIEVNVNGLVLGRDETGGTHPFSGLVSGNSFEANYIAIACVSFNNGSIQNFSIQGAETGQGTPAPLPAGGQGQALAGISSGALQNVTIANGSIGSGHTSGGMVFAAVKPVATTVKNIDCRQVTVGTPWVIPADHKGGLHFGEGNYGLTDADLEQTYANLAAYEAEQSGANVLPVGTVRYLSDGSTATWGATVTGSGANHVVAVKGRSGAWKVMGLT